MKIVLDTNVLVDAPQLPGRVSSDPDDDMFLAAALWVTERQVRRVKGHRQLPLLQHALHATLSVTHSAAA